MRFENLSADPSLDWMGLGFAEMVAGELQGSPQLYAIQWRTLHSLDASLGRRPDAPGISTERSNALAVGANEIIYGTFAVVNGVLRAHATEEDLTTHRIVRSVSASAPVSEGIFPVADALARQIYQTKPIGTQNPNALRAFVAGLGSPDAAAAAQSFAQAIAADPGFGRAYVLALDTAMAQRDGAAAGQILHQARAHQAQFSALDRAQLDLDQAAMQGDFQGQLRARRELTQLDPADPNHHRALAEQLMSVRDYDAAIVEFRRALSIRPDDIASLNSMGYAAAYAGDLPTAVRVLRGYEQKLPNEPNPLDSLGDAHFALGHFREAEQFYLAARAKSPGFLNGGETMKAAQARLMTGDVSGATALFNQWLTQRQAAHDPFAEYHRAAWLWQTGARREALASLDRVASGTVREVSCRADSLGAIWLLNLGDRAGAVAHVRKAMTEAGPADVQMVTLVALLAQPGSLPIPPQSPLNAYAAAYGSLLAGNFQAALPPLQELYRRPTAEPDDGIAVLLAWTYAQTGDWRQAQPLLRLTPLPQPGGLPMFESLYFPRLFDLRAAVLEREAHPNEAAQYRELYRKLSGS